MGIAQQPRTQNYYLVFYNEINTMLDKFLQIHEDIKFMQYTDFYEIKDIGAGGYGTVYKARHKINEYPIKEHKYVVLKQFNNFDLAPALFISEVSIAIVSIHMPLI